MKVSRLGIKMYEMEDSIPGSGSPVGRAINCLRVEVNKIAEILDEMDDRMSCAFKEWQMINQRERIENVHYHPERNRDRD